MVVTEGVLGVGGVGVEGTAANSRMWCSPNLPLRF